MTKNKKGIFIAISLIVILAIAAVSVYLIYRPKTAAGEKTITAQVIKDNEIIKTVTIKTNADFLRQALEQEKIVSGVEGEYGLFVKTAAGITVNEANQEWWCFTKDGEAVNTSVDQTPIKDKDKFEITFKTGY